MSKKEKPVVQNNETKAKPKKNRLAEVFMKDYRFEGLILLILAIVAIVLGVLILVGTLTIDANIPVLGDYPKVFAWILVGLGVVSLGLAVWPFYKPSVEEVKRVTWPTGKQFLYDSLIVLLFIAVLALFYTAIDTGFSALVSWLEGLK